MYVLTTLIHSVFDRHGCCRNPPRERGHGPSSLICDELHLIGLYISTTTHVEGLARVAIPCFQVVDGLITHELNRVVPLLLGGEGILGSCA